MHRRINGISECIFLYAYVTQLLERRTALLLVYSNVAYDTSVRAVVPSAIQCIQQLFGLHRSRPSNCFRSIWRGWWDVEDVVTISWLMEHATSTFRRDLSARRRTISAGENDYTAGTLFTRKSRSSSMSTIGWLGVSLRSSRKMVSSSSFLPEKRTHQTIHFFSFIYLPYPHSWGRRAPQLPKVFFNICLRPSSSSCSSSARCHHHHHHVPISIFHCCRAEANSGESKVGRKLFSSDWEAERPNETAFLGPLWMKGHSSINLQE